MLSQLDLLPKNSKKILALSIDFDHSLAHNLKKLKTLDNPEDKIKQIVKDNEPLLKKIAIKAINENYETVILLIGSNRQSWNNDYYCGTVHETIKATGSCYPTYLALTAQLHHEITLLIQTKKSNKVNAIQNSPHVELFPGLMADIYSLLPPGTCFNHAMEINSNPAIANELFRSYSSLFQSKHHIDTWLSHKKMSLLGKNGLVKVQAPYVFDHSKILLLYAQMHTIAKIFHNKNINFLFLDDNIPTILSSLKSFYSVHSDLIPDTLFLQLHPYNGLNHESQHLNPQSAYYCTPGKGGIDYHYQESIIFWSAISLELLNYNHQNKSLTVDQSLTTTDAHHLNLNQVQRNIFSNIFKPIHAENRNSRYTHTHKKIELFKLIRKQRASMHNALLTHPLTSSIITTTPSFNASTKLIISPPINTATILSSRLTASTAIPHSSLPTDLKQASTTHAPSTTSVSSIAAPLINNNTDTSQAPVTNQATLNIKGLAPFTFISKSSNILLKIHYGHFLAQQMMTNRLNTPAVTTHTTFQSK